MDVLFAGCSDRSSVGGPVVVVAAEGASWLDAVRWFSAMSSVSLSVFVPSRWCSYFSSIVSAGRGAVGSSVST